MIAADTRKRTIMQGCQSHMRAHGAGPPFFQLRWKALLSIFLHLFNKIVLKQQHAENTVESAELDVLDFLK